MSESGPASDPVDSEGNRDERLARVIFDCTSRMSSGEILDPKDVISANPDLVPELELAMKVLREASPPDGGRPPLESIGGHRILREIGRGGMGVVYEAVELALGRRVALKVLPLPPFVDERRRDRFLREARAAARLHHTRIVPVFEVGEERGVLFYTMQFIPGRSLDRVLRELARRRKMVRGGAAPAESAGDAEEELAGLLLGEKGSHSDLRAYHRAVARIGSEVADAIHHAHREGVLHRDVKPSNIILDSHGSAWLTDFGLAKNDFEPDALTHSGDVVGTVAYMAPERFSGKADARSDICSLGATLYEMLVLRPAFHDSDQKKLIRKVAEDDPRPLRQIDPEIPRDLETVVLKAMAREPERRFSSGAELQEELERFLRGEPIRSRFAGPFEKTLRWCRRYPVSSSLGGAVAILLITLLVVTLLSTQRLAQRLYVAEISTARALRASGSPGRRFESLAAIGRAVKSAPTGSDRAALRDEAIAALALADIREVSRHSEPLTRASIPVFDQDLEQYAILDAKLDQIAIRRVRDGTEIRRLEGGARTKTILSFSPDGSFLGTQSIAGDRHRLRVVRVADGSVVLERETGLVDADLRFYPGGRVLVGEADGSISTVVIQSGAVERTLRPRAAAKAFKPSPDSRRIFAHLASVSALDIIDLDDEKNRITVQLTAPYFGADWSPDGRLIAVPTEGRIDLWDARTGDFFQSLEGHLGAVTEVIFSPDGLLASISWDSTLRLWDPWCGDPLLTTAAPLPGFSFSRDGKTLATAMADVAVFEIERGTARQVLASPAAPKGVGGIGMTTHSGGRVLATTVSLWDLEEGRELSSRHDGWNPIQFCFAPGGGSVWLNQGSDMVEQVVECSARPEEEIFVFGPTNRLVEVPSGLVAMDFDGSGRIVVWVETNLQVVRYQRAEHRKEIVGRHPGSDQVSVTSDGRWAVTGTYNRGKGLKIWDLSHLALAGELEPSRSSHGGFSPSGRWLATATGNAYAIHDVGTWSLRFTFSRDAENNVPGPYAWSPDGNLLAVTLTHGVVTILDVEAGTVAARLSPPQPRGILCLELTPDGERLVAGCANGAMEVWDLRRIAAGLEAIGLELGRGLTPPGVRRPRRPLRVEFAGEGAIDTTTPEQVAAAASRLAASDAWNEAIHLWEKALESSPGSALDKNNLAWVLATAPEKFRDSPRALALAEAAVRESGGNTAFLNTLGAAHYRMGNYKQAIDVLLRGAKAGSGVTAWDGFFIAMALKRLGLDSLASYHFDGATHWLERHKELQRGQARELSALRDEAASVLGSSEPAGESASPAPGSPSPKS